MLITVTQLDKSSTAQLQCVYKYLPFRYLIDSLSLLGSFASWYLLVYLTRSKPTVNEVLIIIINNSTRLYAFTLINMHLKANLHQAIFVRFSPSALL